MDALFLKLVNMSITASYLILGIVLLRLLFRKTPKWILVLLWGLVGLRLLLPFSIESKQSMIPTTDPISQQILYTPVPTVPTELPDGLNTAPTVFNDIPAPAPHIPQTHVTEAPIESGMGLAAKLWLIGMVLMIAYSLFSYLRLRRSLREAIPYRGNIWLCDKLPSPFLLGLFRPRIYIPSDLGQEDLPYALAHEEAHLKRRDHWWKPLGYLLLTVYWFNPLLWVAYILLCRDIEGACDERVLRDLGQEGKKPYSQSLLRCSIPKRRLSACPVAFGEGNVKGRISSILSYKKPTLWILILALVATAVLSLWFLTDPPDPYSPEEICRFDLLLPQTPETAEKMYDKHPIPGYYGRYLFFLGQSLTLHRDGVDTELFPDAYIYSGYFADLDQDGSVELCCSGFPRMEETLLPVSRAYVYDFARDKSYCSSSSLPAGSYYFTLTEGKVALCKLPYNSGHSSIPFSFREQKDHNLDLIRNATAVTYTTPLLCVDPRSGETVFAYKLQEALYPFYLSWDGKLLSEMDDRELTTLLQSSISGTHGLSDSQLELARFVMADVEKDPSCFANYADEYAPWNLQVEQFAAEYYGYTLSNNPSFNTEDLTLEKVIELSHMGHRLTWEDLAPYKATDVGSGFYVMEFPINDRYTLTCIDGKLNGFPMSAGLMDQQTGLSIDIRRGLVESFLRTPTYETWFASVGNASILTATHPTIPELRFTLDRAEETVSVSTGEEEIFHIYSTGILNAYFADVTLDGVADLCYSYAPDKSLSCVAVGYYDPMNRIVQTIGHNTSYHYTLDDNTSYDHALEERNGILLICSYPHGSPEEAEYYDLRVVATGARPAPADLTALKEAYPHFFGLNTENGLTLYISEYKQGAFSCRLVSRSTTEGISQQEVLQLTPCSSAQMFHILDDYLDKDLTCPLYLVPLSSNYSDLVYPTPQAYAKALQGYFSSYRPILLTPQS